MFKATKRTLTALAVIVGASTPSAAYARFDLNPLPSATVSGQTQTPNSPLVAAAESAETLRRDAHLGPRGNANPITAAAAIKRQAEQIAAAKAASRATDTRSHTKAAETLTTSFQWGDAAIGAAGMFLLLTAASVATIASRRWHHRATTS